MPCSTSDGRETKPPTNNDDGTATATTTASTSRSRRETEAVPRPVDGAPASFQVRVHVSTPSVCGYFARSR